MKNKALLFTGLFGLLACASCSGGQPSKPQYDYTKEMQYQKLWLSSVIYNETCCFIEREDGTIYGQLLHNVAELISVRDYTLKNEIDPSNYRVEGNRIYLTEGANLPYFTQENLRGENLPDEYAISTYEAPNNSKIMWTEGSGIVMHHIAVTYRHTESWDGAFPASQKDKFPKTIAKLEAKEHMNIVFYGDSIMTGCNSSEKLSIEPYQEDFPTAFTSELKRFYGYDDIEMFNSSKGGMLSDWGAQNVEALVANEQYNPDLVIIGFGMNDGSWKIPADTFIANIKKIIDAVRAFNPNCEIMTVSTILPNPGSIQYQLQPQYVEPLRKLTESYEGAAMMDMSTFSGDLFKYKNSLDMLANNINHPSDFLVRQYTSNLLNMLGL